MRHISKLSGEIVRRQFVSIGNYSFQLDDILYVELLRNVGYLHIKLRGEPLADVAVRDISEHQKVLINLLFDLDLDGEANNAPTT